MEAQVSDIRRDIDARVEQEDRTRKRLHDIEGTLRSIVELHKQARAQEDRQYRRLAAWMQILTVVVAVAAFSLSLVIVLTHHG